MPSPQMHLICVFEQYIIEVIDVIFFRMSLNKIDRTLHESINVQYSAFVLMACVDRGPPLSPKAH